jgi:general secretion pathway protein D
MAIEFKSQLPVLAVFLLLASCQLSAVNSDQIQNTQPTEQSFDPVELATSKPQSPIQNFERQSPREDTTVFGTETFYSGSSKSDKQRQISSPDQSGETFLFRQAPIDAVVNEILGEKYGLSYSIDPNVNGTLSLRLTGISNSREAVTALNAALGLQGVEVAEAGGSFLVRRVGRGSEAQGEIQFLGERDLPAPDTSVAIIKLRYARTDDVVALARSVLSDSAIQFEDDARGFIVVSGEPDTVAQSVELIRSLDVDWLAAISTAIVPIEYAAPSDIAREAEPIFSRLGGVSVVPLERLQSLLVLSRTRQALLQTKDWIAKLDRSAGPKLMNDLLIYEAKYADAVDLAALAEGSRRSGSRTSQLAVPATRADQGVQSSLPQPNARSSSSSGEISIQVDESQNSVVARGSRGDLEALSDLLTTLDRPRRQVLIEATIVEVSLTDSSSLGVEWDAVQDQLSATLSDDANRPVASLFPGLSLSYINADISAVVNALAQASEVEVISSPRMVVLNNETARLQIGDQVPIITQSAVSITDPGAPVVNSTSYRDTGIILTVTPSVRAGGMVEVEIAQEVSGVAETTTSNIDSPTISQRSLESVLAVPDGSTAVLGGLMSSTRSRSDSGVPYLKDVPVVGSLFRSSSTSERRTELIILLKPTVVLGDTPLVTVPERLAQALRDVREPN